MLVTQDPDRTYLLQKQHQRSAIKKSGTPVSEFAAAGGDADARHSCISEPCDGRPACGRGPARGVAARVGGGAWAEGLEAGFGDPRHVELPRPPKICSISLVAAAALLAGVSAPARAQPQNDTRAIAIGEKDIGASSPARRVARRVSESSRRPPNCRRSSGASS